MPYLSHGYAPDRGRAGVYRIETIAADGHHWLLRPRYPTEEAAMMRLERLNAMGAADIPELRMSEFTEPKRKQ